MDYKKMKYVVAINEFCKQGHSLVELRDFLYDLCDYIVDVDNVIYREFLMLHQLVCGLIEATDAINGDE